MDACKPWVKALIRRKMSVLCSWRQAQSCRALEHWPVQTSSVHGRDRIWCLSHASYQDAYERKNAQKTMLHRIELAERAFSCLDGLVSSVCGLLSAALQWERSGVFPNLLFYLLWDGFLPADGCPSCFLSPSSPLFPDIKKRKCFLPYFSRRAGHILGLDRWGEVVPSITLQFWCLVFQHY